MTERGAPFKLAFLRYNANRIAESRNPICVIYGRLLRSKIYKIRIGDKKSRIVSNRKKNDNISILSHSRKALSNRSKIDIQGVL